MKGKRENAFSGKQRDNVRNETHVVSVMIHWTLETEYEVRDDKDDRLLPHHIRSQRRLTARDKTITGIRQ